MGIVSSVASVTVCPYVCVPALSEKNDLSYQLEIYVACIDPGVKKSKVTVTRLSNALLAWILQIDMFCSVL